jgi:HAD superfamily hydrolase (TIGR01509 family)
MHSPGWYAVRERSVQGCAVMQGEGFVRRCSAAVLCRWRKVHVGNDLVTRWNQLAGRASRLRLVIFDCDGVLIDSEPVVNEVVAAELTRLGWPMSAEECCARFLGLSLDAMVPVIESRLGRALPPDWQGYLTARIVQVLRTSVPTMPGAKQALAAVSAMGLAWRIASNSSHEEMEAKFACNGLLPLVAGRLHSFTDVRRGKPAPDLFLAAAEAEGFTPTECLVIEDSVPGVQGAVAAGMRCLGYAPKGDRTGLEAAGATLFGSLWELPEILRAVVRDG